MTPTQKGLSSAIRSTYRLPLPARVIGWSLFFACGLAMAAILLSGPALAPLGRGGAETPVRFDQPAQPPFASSPAGAAGTSAEI